MCTSSWHLAALPAQSSPSPHQFESPPISQLPRISPTGTKLELRGAPYGECCKPNDPTSCTKAPNYPLPSWYCQPGYYLDGPAKQSCRPCPADTFVDVWGSKDPSACKQCPWWGIAPKPGMGKCDVCLDKFGNRGYHSTDTKRCSFCTDYENWNYTVAFNAKDPKGTVLPAACCCYSNSNFCPIPPLSTSYCKAARFFPLCECFGWAVGQMDRCLVSHVWMCVCHIPAGGRGKRRPLPISVLLPSLCRQRRAAHGQQRHVL